jgi:ABC-type Fe3+ transport system permease subunit
MGCAFWLKLGVWAVVSVCCLAPLGWIAWQVVSHPGVFVELAPDWFRMKLLLRTVVYNLGAGVIALVLALPVAAVIGRGRGWMVVVSALSMPLVLLMPSIVYAYGWSQFFRLNDAILTPASPADVMRCIWTLGAWLWPVPAGVIGLALRRVDRQVQQQALLDGVLWRVTARQVAGPVLAGFAIASVLALQEFAVYEPTGVSVIATEVRMVFETGAYSSADNPITAPLGMDAGWEDLGLPNQAARAAAAVVTAIPMLLVVGLLVAAAAWGSWRLSVTEALEVGDWPRALDARWLARGLSLLVIIVTLIVPVAAMILSLKRDWDLSRVLDVYSPYVEGSLGVALAAGIAGFLVAMSAAAVREKNALLVAGLGFLVGGQLLAIGLIRLYNQPGLEKWVYNAPPIVVMAYLSRFVWIGLAAGRWTWSGSFRQMRELSAVDGAGALRTAWHVVWPLAWPVCVAAGVLLMILSLSEVPATVLIAPLNPPMLIPYLMGWVHQQRSDDMIEASLLLVGMVGSLVAILVGLLWWAPRLRRGVR